MIPNAYTLLIIYARLYLTPIYIACLSCLLIVEELIYQFKLNEDLHQLSGIRYESRSFSVRYLVSLVYRKGFISGVKMSVVVPQAIGISLRNKAIPLRKVNEDAVMDLYELKVLKNIVNFYSKSFNQS